MIEISKELLSAVLGVEVTNVRDTMYDNELRFETTDEELRRKFSPYVPKINIYELGFKCKEWAYNKGIILVSGYYPNGNIYCSTNNILKGIFNESRADTEIEAVIKACEWILKETKK